jgi:hypothetical protein
MRWFLAPIPQINHESATVFVPGRSRYRRCGFGPIFTGPDLALFTRLVAESSADGGHPILRIGCVEGMLSPNPHGAIE